MSTFKHSRKIGIVVKIIIIEEAKVHSESAISKDSSIQISMAEIVTPILYIISPRICKYAAFTFK